MIISPWKTGHTAAQLAKHSAEGSPSQSVFCQGWIGCAKEQKIQRGSFHPWKCPRPRWTGLGVTWFSGSCSWFGIRLSLNLLPTETILGFEDTGAPGCGRQRGKHHLSEEQGKLILPSPVSAEQQKVLLMLPLPSSRSQETPRPPCPPTNPVQAQLRLVLFMETPSPRKALPC